MLKMIKFRTIMSYTFPVMIILILIRKYREKQWGYCRNKKSLKGKVAIITGANCGIGYEVAKDFVHRGANVIFACRNIDAASTAILKIQTELAYTAKMIPMVLDLASLKSVHEFVEHVVKSFPAIHILVNNAGVAYPDKQVLQTKDGFEIHMGVNHLGHFLLTNLLLPQLKQGHARIIIVSSTLHQKGTIYLDDLNMNNNRIGKTPAYANSKLANAYFSRELAKRVEKDHVNTYTVCPGWVKTGLFRNHDIRWYKWMLISPIAFFFMRMPKQGAQTIIYCATEDSLEKETGLFYRDCKRFKSSVQFDETIQERLWLLSEKLTS